MQFSPLHIQQDVPLCSLTTLGVGGRARFFLRAESEDEVASAVHFAQARELALLVIGGGSNLVISDRGWQGLVLQIGILGIEPGRSSDGPGFEVGAGVAWDSFVAHSVSLGYGGIECLSGIPGSVGGTPVQNVGAYGQEVSATILSVLVFDRAQDRVRRLTAAECNFRYRQSVFNSEAQGRYIILRVDYRLRPNPEPSLLYADLERYFAARSRTPTLEETRRAVLEIRAAKGMLIRADDPDSRSVGSFFKNPVLSSAAFESLRRKALERNLEVPNYPALTQQKKVSAAWLLENSGFSKGYTRGHVGLSTKHALAIVNRGGATADEVVALQEEIQRRVEETWGIHLDPEPVLVGF
jgi:UDP-N-acetylmuramate dehydrogenase